MRNKALFLKFFLLLFVVNGNLGPGYRVEAFLLQDPTVIDSQIDALKLELTKPAPGRASVKKAYAMALGTIGSCFSTPKYIPVLQSTKALEGVAKYVKQSVNSGKGPRPPTQQFNA